MLSIPSTQFQDGSNVPIIGLGTWKSAKGEVGKVVKQAIDIGYRHIDCAYMYHNEKEIGEALKEKISDGSVKREELFITSKVWNTHHRSEKVLEMCKQSLEDLQLDYLDLYLIHWPIAFHEDKGDLPAKEDGKADLVDVDFVETWKAMQDLVKNGLVRSLGVSNFNSKQVQRILDLDLEYKMQCNQIEVHPYLNNAKLIDFCKERNVKVVAYSPLGSGGRPWAKPDDPKLLDEPIISEIAKKHNVSVGQVLLKWGLTRGYCILAKTVNRNRLRENIQLFDFTLTDEDMKSITSLNSNFRFCDFSILDCTASPYWPLDEEF